MSERPVSYVEWFRIFANAAEFYRGRIDYSTDDIRSAALAATEVSLRGEPISRAIAAGCVVFDRAHLYLGQEAYVGA